MSSYLYEFIPFFTGGAVALSLLFKIYKRSITTFIYIISQQIVINLFIYGYIDQALVIMLLTMFLLLVRAMAKSANDKFFNTKLMKHKKELK